MGYNNTNNNLLLICEKHYNLAGCTRRGDYWLPIKKLIILSKAVMTIVFS